jgi:hypothetical protein
MNKNQLHAYHKIGFERLDVPCVIYLQLIESLFVIHINEIKNYKSLYNSQMRSDNNINIIYEKRLR